MIPLHAPIIDEDDNLHIIECNPRFGGASTLGIVAGVDSLFWSLLEASGFNTLNYPFMPMSCSIRQIKVTSNKYIFDLD